MKQYLVISAIGKDRPAILQDLSRAIRDNSCNVVESRMTLLGSDFAILLLISGNWNTITRLEAQLPRLCEQLELSLACRRTGEREPRRDLIPYAIDAVCVDQPGIVFNLADFFTEREIVIADLSTRSYQAANTGAPMFAVQMAVNIPAGIQVAALREDFMEFCDQLNLDAIMEPIKN